MSDDCQLCDVEKECVYPYKPCACVGQRKFIAHNPEPTVSPLSQCCDAVATAEGGKLSQYYLCTMCGKPCDVKLS